MGHYEMKRVLIISYYFSDLRDIASVRINGLAKFLPQFGWEPSILTAKFSQNLESKVQFNVFESFSENNLIKFKRMLGLKWDQPIKESLNLGNNKNRQTHIDLAIKLWEEIFVYPDHESHWRKTAVELGDKLITNKRFDAIISSSGPPTCHLIAKELKEKHNIPWIADFRDLWTQNHNYQYSKLRRFFEQRLELKTLSFADVLTATSVPFSESLKQIHTGKNVYVITNGFDPSQINYGTNLQNKFTISYTGSIYRGYQDPKPFFSALAYLIDSCSINAEEISVEFYGHKNAWLAEDIRKYKLDDFVKILGLIPRELSIEKLRSSHLLLLLTWNDHREKGVIPAKIFDYLAARRPILSIGSTTGSAVELILRETNSGVHCPTDLDIRHMIMNAYAEFKCYNTVSYSGNPHTIDRYSHIEMTKRFSEILDKQNNCNKNSAMNPSE